jgi:transposase
VSTDAPPSRAPRASACEPHRERIEAAVRLGRNAMAIWQDLVDDVGFRARDASVRRFVRQLRRTAPPEARVVIATTPGEEGRSITAKGRWSGIWPPVSTGGRACLS